MGESRGRIVGHTGPGILQILGVVRILGSGPEGPGAIVLGTRGPPAPGFLSPEALRQQPPQQHRQHQGRAPIHARGLLAGLAWDPTIFGTKHVKSAESWGT